MTGVIASSCAVAGRGQAEAIATALVERRLAACVQIGRIESVYRWDGAVRCDDEWLLTVKTTEARFDEAAACIRALHDHEVPEIVAMPVTTGSTDYLDWVRSETAGS